MRKAGHSKATQDQLPIIADYLEGKWDVDGCSIGEAVQACCGNHISVSVMEAIRLRTAPLTVNGWQRIGGRTEREVLAMLRQTVSFES